jgi:hypothetical protein
MCEKVDGRCEFFTVPARLHGTDWIIIDGLDFDVVNGQVMIPVGHADRLRALGLVLLPLPAEA